MSTDHLIYKEESKSIIGSAMTVLNKIKQQCSFSVRYKGHLTENLIPDLIVDDKIIADLKVVKSFNDTHLAQMIGYLAKTDYQLALLLNFKTAKLQWKRVVREKTIRTHPRNPRLKITTNNQ